MVIDYFEVFSIEFYPYCSALMSACKCVSAVAFHSLSVTISVLSLYTVCLTFVFLAMIAVLYLKPIPNQPGKSRRDKKKAQQQQQQSAVTGSPITPTRSPGTAQQHVSDDRVSYIVCIVHRLCYVSWFVMFRM